MGMSTRVVGFVPPDDTWQRMRAVHDACTAAGTDPPEEVEDFFGGEDPDGAGREVNVSARPWEDRDTLSEGLEVVLADLPDNVKILRFVNSY